MNTYLDDKNFLHVFWGLLLGSIDGGMNGNGTKGLG